MTGPLAHTRSPESAFQDDAFDRLEAALAKWMEAERQLAEAHLDLARELQADLTGEQANG